MNLSNFTPIEKALIEALRQVVYYAPEHDNFYNRTTKAGCGNAFYMKLRPYRDLFVDEPHQHSDSCYRVRWEECGEHHVHDRGCSEFKTLVCGR